jgi:3-phytase
MQARTSLTKIQTLLVLFALGSVAHAQASLTARVETAPVPSSGDAADDPAIWVHPTNPALSVVIATDKQSGLAVYDLAGQQLQFLSGGEPNNVDLRKDFLLGGQRVTLVATGDRANNSMRIYKLDPSTRTLSNIAARTITFGLNIYGCCMYRSPTTGDFYFMATSKEGNFEQWRLFDAGSGRVDATQVRAFDVGGQCEGCVADDETGFLFIGEEAEGVWRYGAEPTAGSTRLSVDDTNGSNLTADVEGLSIYYASGGRGYLVVSSQGNNTFSVYQRQAPHQHVLNFEIVSGSNGVDGVTDCDGIDVMNLGMGSAFPDGLFVAQDGSNTGGNQNFKFLSWRDIAGAASPQLVVDNSYDPHGSSACTTTASFTYRNGSNPRILTTTGAPVVGTMWRVDLNCSGHASSGQAILFAKSQSASGIFGTAGELLVNPVGPFQLVLATNHLGGTAQFQLMVPPTLPMCGLVSSVQGLCYGQPGAQLSNAIDVVLGN